MNAKYKCPFCGHHRIEPQEQEIGGYYVAVCYKCGARGPADNNSREEALDEWDGWINTLYRNWECENDKP